MAIDQQLIEKMKTGDQEAFRMIYMEYKDNLLTVANSLLRDLETAEDVVHDVFVNFTKNIQTFQLRGNLRSFLITCVANRARDILRKQKRQSKYLAGQTEPAPPEKPDKIAEKNDLVESVKNGLAQIPYEQQEVLILKTKASMTFREIAKVQKTTISTVQGRYRYGIERLRSLLNGELK